MSVLVRPVIGILIRRFTSHSTTGSKWTLASTSLRAADAFTAPQLRLNGGARADTTITYISRGSYL